MNWVAIREKTVTTVITAAMLGVMGTAVGGMWNAYRNQQDMINRAVEQERERVTAVVDVLAERLANAEANLTGLRNDFSAHFVNETNLFMSDWTGGAGKKEIIDQIKLDTIQRKQ